MFRHRIKVKKLGISEEDNPMELFFRMAEKWREMTEQPIYEAIPVEDVTND